MNVSPGRLFLLIAAVMYFSATTNASFNRTVSSLGFWTVIIFCSWTLSTYIWRLIPRKKVSPANKAVLITGCDRGFGNMLAKKLHAAGYYVYAGCLFPDADEALELKKNYPERMHILKLDVTKDDDVQAAFLEVQSTLNEKVLWSVVNNAGIGICSVAEWGGLSQYERQIDVNTLGLIRVTLVFLPLLRKTRGSRVVLVASILGRIIIPTIAGYSVSKCAVIAFADALRREMAVFGVKVITIEPSLYRTAITSNEYVSRTIEECWNQSSEEVRNVYGETFHENLKKLVAISGSTARSDLYEVVNSMADAVSARSPLITYRCMGVFEEVLLWIFLSLPQKWTDGVMSSIYFKYTGLPECVRNRPRDRANQNGLARSFKRFAARIFTSVFSRVVQNRSSIK